MTKNYHLPPAAILNLSAQVLASVSCFMVSISAGSRVWIFANFLIALLFAVAARSYLAPPGAWNPDPRRDAAGGTLLRILLASTLCLAVAWHRPIGGLMGCALLITGAQGAMSYFKESRQS